jgi:hypothetical protein
VPFEKPRIAIQPGYKPFVNIPQPPGGKFSEAYYHEMIKVLNKMNKNFPNKCNNSIHNDKLRPARSHLKWSYMVSALIAYHLANNLGNKPLSKTFINYGKSKKWKYSTTDEELTEQMKKRLIYIFSTEQQGSMTARMPSKTKKNIFRNATVLADTCMVGYKNLRMREIFM